MKNIMLICIISTLIFACTLTLSAASKNDNQNIFKDNEDVENEYITAAELLNYAGIDEQNVADINFDEYISSMQLPRQEIYSIPQDVVKEYTLHYIEDVRKMEKFGNEKKENIIELPDTNFSTVKTLTVRLWKETYPSVIHINFEDNKIYFLNNYDLTSPQTADPQDIINNASWSCELNDDIYNAILSVLRNAQLDQIDYKYNENIGWLASSHRLSLVYDTGVVHYEAINTNAGKAKVIVDLCNTIYNNLYKYRNDPNFSAESAMTEYKCPYTDITDHWAKDYIIFTHKNNLIDGITAIEFKPGEPMTREMFVIALARMMGIEKDYIDWAVEIGLILGYGDGNLGLEDTVTREQMAVFFERYLNLTNTDIDSLKQQDKVEFSDDATISDWAKSSVYRMQEIKLLQGKENMIFDPLDEASRAEGATVIYNLNQILK